jgi:hypothetical protein
MDYHHNAAYYWARAQQEDAAARRALNPLAATIHRSLASRYRAKADELEDSQLLSIVRD